MLRSLCGMEPGIPRWAAMCRMSSACRTLILCVAAEGVLIVVTSPSQQKGQMPGSNQRRVSNTMRINFSAAC